MSSPGVVARAFRPVITERAQGAASTFFFFSGVFVMAGRGFEPGASLPGARAARRPVTSLSRASCEALNICSHKSEYE